MFRTLCSLASPRSVFVLAGLAASILGGCASQHVPDQRIFPEWGAPQHVFAVPVGAHYPELKTRRNPIQPLPARRPLPIVPLPAIPTIPGATPYPTPGVTPGLPNLPNLPPVRPSRRNTSAAATAPVVTVVPRTVPAPTAGADNAPAATPANTGNNSATPLPQPVQP